MELPISNSALPLPPNTSEISEAPRLSLYFTSKDSSPIFCRIFVGPLVARLLKGLKFEQNKYDHEEEPDDFEHLLDAKLIDEQASARHALYKAIWDITTGPLSAELEAEVSEEIRKRPEHLKPKEVDGKVPSDNIRALNDMIYGLSALYGPCFPREDREHLEAGDSTTRFLHSAKRPCEMKYDQQEIDQTIRILRYRLERMEIVQRYLEFLQIPLPNGQNCRDYDVDEFNRKYKRRILVEKAYSSLEWTVEEAVDKSRAALFPSATWEGLRFPIHFGKDYNYFTIAMFYSQLPIDEYCLRIQKLGDAFKAELDRTISWLKTIPEVREKARKVYEACGAEFS